MKQFMKKFVPLISIILATSFGGGCMAALDTTSPPQLPRHTATCRKVRRRVSGGFLRGPPWWQIFQDPQLRAIHRPETELRHAACHGAHQSRARAPRSHARILPRRQGTRFTGGKEQEFSVKINFALTARCFPADLFISCAEKPKRRAPNSLPPKLRTAYRHARFHARQRCGEDYFTLRAGFQLQITRDTVKTQRVFPSNSLRFEDHGVATKLMCFRRSKCSTPPMLRYPTSRTKSARRKTPSASSYENIPRRSVDACSWSSRATLKCSPGLLSSRCSERRPDIPQAERGRRYRERRKSASRKRRSSRKYRRPSSGGGAFGRSSVFTA